MKGKLYVGTDKKEFNKVLDAYTDKNVETDRISRILRKYSPKYKSSIDGEVATVQGKRIHVDYLPTIDAMLEAKARYKHPREVVGAALFKIERDKCIFLTESRDPDLQRVYEVHQREANELADKLWEMNTEEFDYQLTHAIATVLSGSFAAVFGQSYGDWRKSLAELTQK
ncbi:hypothetical protein HZB03_05130 [Candidatus Woesearchaeota archaeon]|nr:hypothetical protein [Candidatus Woesearchaeota archaeon]